MFLYEIAKGLCVEKNKRRTQAESWVPPMSRGWWDEGEPAKETGEPDVKEENQEHVGSWALETVFQ